MISLITFLSAVVLLHLTRSLLHLESNVRKARRLEVPIIRVPFDENDYGWVTVQPLIWRVLSLLPVQWASYPDFVRFSHRNWHFLEKSAPAMRFGPAWAIVSPGGVHLHFTDPDAIQSIFSRWRDFIRPTKKYQMLNVFGPSVFTVDPVDWPRHRRAVAAPFNESIMKFVWQESLRQAQAILRFWESKSDMGIPDLEGDLHTFSLNVLAASAFQDSYEFFGSEGPRASYQSLDNYRDALSVLQKNSILLMLVPYRFLAGSFMPKTLLRIGDAARLYKQIMVERIKSEMDSLNEGQSGSSGFIASVVGALERNLAKQSADGGLFPTNSRATSLSLDEVLGNMFVIHFAGYDTTANTLAFALMLLAGNPEVQSWLSEEVNSVFPETPVEDWDYALFPRLQRCQAVFLETLRLYAPITGLPKMSSSNEQALSVGDKVLSIPANTEIFPMILSMQTDPRYWDEPYVWRPSRWILQSSGDSEAGAIQERLFVPEKGTFFPWSDGAQLCAGKKMSQVEGAAMLACLFQSNGLRVKQEPSETKEHAEQRARACVEDVNYQLLLKMNNSARVRLRCVTLSV